MPDRIWWLSFLLEIFQNLNSSSIFVIMMIFRLHFDERIF